MPPTSSCSFNAFATLDPFAASGTSNVMVPSCHSTAPPPQSPAVSAQPTMCPLLLIARALLCGGGAKQYGGGGGEERPGSAANAWVGPLHTAAQSATSQS